MNRIERRVRNMINPYSSAFAIWWCHSARYWRLPAVITGRKTAARPGLPRPAVPRTSVGEPEGFGIHTSPYMRGITGHSVSKPVSGGRQIRAKDNAHAPSGFEDRPMPYPPHAAGPARPVSPGQAGY